MKAAVMREFKAPLEIEEVEIAKPGPREVIVQVKATGVCHSDLHVIDGGLPLAPPVILGHEPAGIVEAVGSEVTAFRKGDPVIGCLSAFCGNCEFCATGRPNLCGGEATKRAEGEPPRLAKDGVEIAQFAHLSAFAEQMLVHENALVKIREDIPLDRAALIGCGVTTGVGAALNTAKVSPGSTCVVIGCGGVGLSAIQGCRIAGASRIIAVDTEPWKLELAKSLGATDGIDGSSVDAVAEVLESTGGGADYAFECIGLTATAAQVVGMIKKGGMAIIVGVMPMTANIEIPGLAFLMSEKRLVASLMGSNSFRVDMPRYVDMYLSGQLKLDEMISDRFALTDINEAFDKMRSGKAARSVIVFD